ncbi:MAG: hypothetical protein B7Z75_04690 [Acidocella sp. 20-57-95]|nr:MAG: hypothetical protein B7Z75_04690 [Acidocella sp. 20-57-95]OYV62565.1 MAG: hypothetical protein B7Z71_00685 [Acidocella sp. 21-58-7]HQT64308.1 hypothetical protein [Acidocella sp.]HQU04473.1 hypothetical protein [Acidocella sp.]
MKLLATALLLLGISPAFADAPPPYLPTRDVVVSYQVATPGRPPVNYQLAYDAGSQQARIDDPAHGNYFLVNLPAGSAQMVAPAFHAIVAAPDLSALTGQLNSLNQARFTPLGPGEYAGLACQKYLILSDQGSGTACLTPDGVTLHFSGHNARGTAEVTAMNVAYQHNESATFAIPPGYSKIMLPPGALAQLLGQ